MHTYIVSHYWQNPKHNTTHKFSNYEEAQQEFLSMSSDEKITGVTYLEVEGDKDSWKKREWNKQRATATSGKFSNRKEA
jgi:hypothetical protein